VKLNAWMSNQPGIDSTTVTVAVVSCTQTVSSPVTSASVSIVAMNENSRSNESAKNLCWNPS
jgi:hypothetical protein